MNENQNKEYRLLPFFTGLFVATLLISNIASAAKLISLGPLVLPAGIILFPISYIWGDILTEVWGYSRSRQVIWTGFACLVLAAATFLIVEILPAPPFWTGKSAYDQILGFVPRIIFASMIAYFCGEFGNSFVVSRMKYSVHGARGLRQAWRFVLSTIVGEGIDTVVFSSIAFIGILSVGELVRLSISLYFVKVIYEIVATPLTVSFANWLKRLEGVDAIDDPARTNYSPFAVFAKKASKS